MPLEMSYFRAIQGATGLNNQQEVVAQETKERLRQDMLTSIACQYDSKRNDVDQMFCVSRTDSVHVYNVIAFPDEDLFEGDLIDCLGVKWIVTKVYATDTIQKRGKMQECNLNLQFQVGTSDIHSCWCFFDKGVYSTTTEETAVGKTGRKQFKMLLPYNDDTKKIQRDKRLASEVLYNPDGTQRLRCYIVTSNDSIGNSFGGGKIWELTVEETQDNPDGDNVEHMICDYIAPAVVPDPEEPGGGDEGGGDDPGGGWW